MKRFAITVLFVLLMLGCKDPYGTAAKLYQDVSVTIGQASTTVDQFRKDGTVSVNEERVIEGYLLSLNNIDATYGACVKAAHGNASLVGGFTSCANTLNASMSNPAMLAALHITNQKAQATLTSTMQGITTLVTTAITALAGK